MAFLMHGEKQLIKCTVLENLELKVKESVLFISGPSGWGFFG